MGGISAYEPQDVRGFDSNTGRLEGGLASKPTIDLASRLCRDEIQWQESIAIMNGAQGGAFAKEGLSAGNTPMVKGAVQGGPAALSIQGVDVDVRMVQEERHTRERAGTRCNVQCGTPRCWYVRDAGQR